jgi:DNA-binding transcriptional LysR family regulator
VAAGLDGRLRISAPVTFARMHLAPKLPAFLAAHPKLRLEVIMDDRDVDLLGENIDVALRVGTLPDSSVVARRIARCERCVVASPAYLAQAGTTHSPSDLLAHQAVIYVQGSGGDEWRFRRGTTELSVSVPSRLTFSAAEGVRGDGGMIVPARPQTRQGVLFCKKEPKNFCS